MLCKHGHCLRTTAVLASLLRRTEGAAEAHGWLTCCGARVDKAAAHDSLVGSEEQERDDRKWQLHALQNVDPLVEHVQLQGRSRCAGPVSIGRPLLRFGSFDPQGQLHGRPSQLTKPVRFTSHAATSVTLSWQQSECMRLQAPTRVLSERAVSATNRVGQMATPRVTSMRRPVDSCSGQQGGQAMQGLAVHSAAAFASVTSLAHCWAHCAARVAAHPAPAPCLP